MTDKSLRWQIAAAAAAGALVTAAGAGGATLWQGGAGSTPAALCGGAVGGLLGIGVTLGLARRALRPIEQLRDSMAAVAGGRLEVAITPSDDASRELRELTEAFGRMVERMREAEVQHAQSRQDVESRTRIVDRLLDFAQTIQGAGRADQIFESLGQALQHALKLEGFTILAHNTDEMPPTQVKSCRPDNLASAERPVGEMDTTLCPCLRQNQPRVFRPDVAGVRCAIETCLKLPTNCAAYCIPFNVGRKQQVVVHMLLPVGEKWSEERRQLAQTYVNTAQSALSSLHLLAEAEKQSMTDSLTGLYNRRSLDQILEREVALADRHKRPLSVVMIDMDLFKEVNDRHGHAAGDHLLKSFAECVRMTLRKTDLAFRYGGDEFLIALPQTTVEQAKAVVQKLRQAFSAVDFSSAIAHLDQQPTLSIGLAERCAHHNVLTLASLLSAADTALYDAKTANRNCIKVYEPKAA
jgi:diguanylate cyclase (GGDEF)-like protein